MSTNFKNTTLKALVDGAIVELMVKTSGSQVWLDENTTLSSKIADMVLAIDAKATPADITTQVDALRQEMLGDTPVEAYNTFTELAQYIADHKEVSDALTEAIGNKADKSVVEAIQTTITALGALANKDTVSESDLDTALAEKVNAAADGNHSHANKEVIDGITAEKVAAWDAKSKVTMGAEDPTDLASGDLYFQFTE